MEDDLMAVTYDVKYVSDNAVTVTWTLANGDTALPAHMYDYADRSIQVAGTFGTGGTVVIQGSNDGSNWATLNDAQGNVLSFTAAKIEGVLEMTRYLRPSVTAGDGTTALTVTFFGRKQQ